MSDSSRHGAASGGSVCGGRGAASHNFVLDHDRLGTGRRLGGAGSSGEGLAGRGLCLGARRAQ